jgi:hypothetical protein
MALDFLHNHPEFKTLIQIVADEKGIDPALIEKDYWIMHCLYGLQKLGFVFQLKGGTSLSKGHHIINRFSEDIDILIEPSAGQNVKYEKNQDKPAQIKSRKDFFDGLAKGIKIDGIETVERDHDFDDKRSYRNAGIRLMYPALTQAVDGLRVGVLLEVGFDQVAPNKPVDISSWLYDSAADRNVEIIDNRAKKVACYEASYTFVEKLQTISTKYRQQQAKGTDPVGFMRHYYDAHELLQQASVQDFIGTEAYTKHKQSRFRSGDNQNIAQNDAFSLKDPAIRLLYEQAYGRGGALYYAGKPSLAEILAEFEKWSDKL